jgi:DNA polymerase-1
LFDVPEDETDAVRTLVKREMESVADLKVPIVVDVGIGQNWRDLKE